MKIAYIGIDLFYPALESLAELGVEVAEIFTCETDNITEFNVEITRFAEKYSIPYTTKRITSDDISRLKKKGCDLGVCGGYYFKIPVDEKFPIVNIHPSLLPLGRGSWPMPVSILRREKFSGVTVHKIAEGFDTGDILLQRRFELTPDETLKTFMKKVYNLIPCMIKELVRNFQELYENAVPQGEGEYIDAPTQKDWTVTCHMTVDEADVILRAFLGYECIYLSENKKYTLVDARAVKSNSFEKKELKLKDGYIEAKRVLSVNNV